MLSKLLKYEFRATGRIMLPVYALLLVTAGGTSVTGSLMGRYPESTVLSIFRTLFMTLFAFTTFGVLLLTLVLMVYRFYKNLMTDEGYLMFTLPVSRSQLIWSKLIVSMAWGILSAVLAALMWTMVLSVTGGENLFAGIFRGLRSLMESLSGNATGCIVGALVGLFSAFMPPLASYFVPFGYYIPLSAYEVANWDKATHTVTYGTRPFNWGLLVFTLALGAVLFALAWRKVQDEEV